MDLKDLYIKHVTQAFEDADNNLSKLPDDVLMLDGMSGIKTRHFYNNLLTLEDTRYLEIGTWKGSSVCSAMYNNRAKVLCIDNWSQFGGPRAEFTMNFNRYIGQNDAFFIEEDCFKIEVGYLPKFNIYMYDGEHSADSQYKALTHYYDCMDDIFIYIVDDWAIEDVRDGTNKAIADLNLTTLYEKHVITEEDGTLGKTGWWNGIYIGIFSKN
jgi:hypothetical protein